METPSAPGDRISQLRDSFVRQLPTRVSELRGLLQALEANSKAGETVLALHRAFHGIKGNSASFGFPEWAALASEGEDRAQAIMQNRTAAAGENWRRIEACISAMDKLLTT